MRARHGRRSCRAGHATRAYDDAPIPIARHQVTTQPSLSAAIIAALGLAGAEEVLEVGTGHGYQTALLTRLAGRVVSTGIWSDLAGQARRNLAAQDIGNVVFLAGDGTGEHRNLPRSTRSWSAPPTLACHRRWPPSSGRGTPGRRRRDVPMPSSFVQLPGRTVSPCQSRDSWSPCCSALAAGTA